MTRSLKHKKNDYYCATPPCSKQQIGKVEMQKKTLPLQNSLKFPTFEVRYNNMLLKLHTINYFMCSVQHNLYSLNIQTLHVSVIRPSSGV
jgi:hypothetical protein